LLNINGDVTATAVARAFKVKSLIFLTNVPGVLDASGKLISELTSSEAENLLKAGVISDGMIPKMQNCLKSLDSVSSTLIVDGRAPHALLNAVDGKIQGTKLSL
jgi:acetylglutamate kinase